MSNSCQNFNYRSNNNQGCGCGRNNNNNNNGQASCGNGQNCCPLLDSNPNYTPSGSAYSQGNSCGQMPDKDCLLKEINETSFATTDMQLYLDTHSCDSEALAYFMEQKGRRVSALKEYAKYYGPLTIDTADDKASNSFAWVETPWPWEGGDC